MPDDDSQDQDNLQDVRSAEENTPGSWRNNASGPNKFSSIPKTQQDIENGGARNQRLDITGKPLKGESLQDLENNASTRSGTRGSLKSGQDEDKANQFDDGRDDGRGRIAKELNKGYTGKGGKGRTWISDAYNSDKRLGNTKESRFNKRVAIAVAAAGGSFLAGIFVFLALLPLKLEHIVANLERKEFAAVNQGVKSTASNAFSDYIARSVLPSIFAGECQSTIDPSCKVTVHCAGSFTCSVYQAWKDGNVEYKMAQQGIIVGKEGKTFYMSVNGEHVGTNEEFDNLRMGRINPKTNEPWTIFDLKGTKIANRTMIRAQVAEKLDKITGFKGVYQRFVVARLLERKYGIKHCLPATCKITDKISDNVDFYKHYAQDVILQRLPIGNYGLIMRCVLAGATGTCDPSKLEEAKPGDDERLTAVHRQLQQDLISFRDALPNRLVGDEALKKLSGTAKAISEEGFQRYVLRQAITKALTSVLGEAAAETAGKYAVANIPVVGWVIAIVLGGMQLIALAGTIGPLLSSGTYQANVAVAVAQYSTLSTAVSEYHTGKTNAAIMGSFDTAMSTSLSGKPGTAADFTQSPLWQEDNLPKPSSGGTSASLFGDLLPGVAYAASPTPDNDGNYLCDDGKTRPTADAVCPEMNFRNAGNALAAAAITAGDGVNSIPGLTSVAKWVTDTANIPGQWIGKGLEFVPGYSLMTGWIGDQAVAPMAWLQKQIITVPGIDSGARMFEMAMAGADAAANAACRISLGCSVISAAVATNIQNQALAEDKAEFEAMPLYARIFNTSTPYSLVSRFAMVAPSSFMQFTQMSVANILITPFQRINSTLASMFSTNSAFAARTPKADPFGITQYANTRIPVHPESYWNENCVNGPSTLYNAETHVLDTSAWQNTLDADLQIGESETPRPKENPCLLVYRTFQSIGGAMGAAADVFPTGTTNPDP